MTDQEKYESISKTILVLAQIFMSKVEEKNLVGDIVNMDKDEDLILIKRCVFDLNQVRKNVIKDSKEKLNP